MGPTGEGEPRRPSLGEDLHRLCHGTGPLELGSQRRASRQHLVFRYTVQPGDVDTDGIQVHDSSLQNPYGIPDYAGFSPNDDWAKDDHEDKVGDTGAPRIVDVDFSSPPYAGRFQPGEVVEITLTADEPVRVEGNTTPFVLMRVTDDYPRATYDAGRSEAAGTNKPVFTWTVRDGYVDDDGFLVAPDYFRDTAGVSDWSGNLINSTLPGYWGNDPHHKVGDLGPPVITDVAITSEPASGTGYRPGETLEVTLAVSEPIIVPSGAEPKLEGFQVGRSWHNVQYDVMASAAASIWPVVCVKW